METLDDKGTLENLPFMPEMVAFCGRQFRVSRQAFKTCVDDAEMRRLTGTVFLEESRCNGSSHNGCDRGCLIFWKTAWLKPAASTTYRTEPVDSEGFLNELNALAVREGKFFCQSSEILNASQPLPWWDSRQYLWDLKYNRVPFPVFARSFMIAVYNKFASVLRVRAWGAITGPGTNGHSPSLNLQPGEVVRVKPLSQIKATLDPEGKNQKLLFAPAMADFCGQVMKVRDRVENIVLEATPHQRKIKDTVVLEGATCVGVCHRMCPRQSLLFWRECWLERVVTN